MLKNVGLTQGFQSEGRRRESKSEDVFFSPPLSSCLISRLACVVVNWFTMSRAVWLRVFLTPALIPLWIGRGQVQERSCRKQDTEVIIDFLVPNIQCQCVCVVARASVHVWMLPALLRHILCCIFGTDIKIHRKVTETKAGTGL